jgi:hypothetical protein
MEFLSPFSSVALSATLALLLTLLLVRWRQRGQRSGRGGNERDAIDTVAGWPPESARVLTSDERRAYELVHRAVPGLLVLAQVPLSRFIRVPMRNSYGEWLQRVGNLSADLLVCDGGTSRVLAVVDIRAVEESARSRKRHERLTRVLKAAGVQVFTWREGDLPSIQQVRSVMSALAPSAPAVPRTAPSSVASPPIPLIPVAEIEEILAEGDRAAEQGDPMLEPVPSGFYDELEPAAATRR